MGRRLVFLLDLDILSQALSDVGTVDIHLNQLLLFSGVRSFERFRPPNLHDLSFSCIDEYHCNANSPLTCSPPYFAGECFALLIGPWTWSWYYHFPHSHWESAQNRSESLRSRALLESNSCQQPSPLKFEDKLGNLVVLLVLQKNMPVTHWSCFISKRTRHWVWVWNTSDFFRCFRTSTASCLGIKSPRFLCGEDS